jgi:hypothetical protein
MKLLNNTVCLVLKILDLLAYLGAHLLDKAIHRLDNHIDPAAV